MTHWIQSSAGRAVLLAALLSPIAFAPLSAQEEESSWSVGVAGEVVSKFMWRGLELNEGASFQPDVWVERGNFAAGVWSSWGADYHEVDTYISWYHELPLGELTLIATDYYLPKEEPGLFDFGGVVDGEATGAHTLELGAEFTPFDSPITFMLGWNAYNDPDKALFGGIGAEFSLEYFDVAGDFGFLLKDSPNYYGGDMGDPTNYTVSVGKSLPMGDREPYVKAALVRSALGWDKTYWVFAIGF